jgi:uncharacterized Fe-S cluster protein YjdI
MIPKDILTNLYLELYQVKTKGGVGPSAAVGRTVRLVVADCPPGHRGPSTRLVGSRCISGRSVSFNGPSAPWVWTVRTPRRLSAGASRIVRACRAPVDPGREGVKPAACLLVPKPIEGASSLSFLPSLKEKAPYLGILIRALPGLSEHIPGLSVRFSTMSSGYFFESLILFLGF